MNQPPSGGVPAGGGPPEFTMEDLATFRRCRKESFWRGCVPMIVGASLAVGFGHSRGFFANRPRLLYPAYFLAGVSGYIGGKVMYVNKCKRMFLELNDSRVKDFLLGNQSQMPSPRRPEFGPWGGGGPGPWGRGPRPSTEGGPLMVDTPPASPEGEPGNEANQPMTYAQRREFYRRQRMQPPFPRQGQQQPQQQPQDGGEMGQPQAPYEVPPSSSGYFDEERPLSSFMSDDTYRPRD